MPNARAHPGRGRAIAFARIAQLANQRIESLARAWLPDGQRKGREFVARNPTRNDRKAGSFRISLTSGRWSDFATGDKGGDAIALYAYLNGLDQAEAAVALAHDLGLDPYTDDKPKHRPPPPPRPRHQPRPARPEDDRTARALAVFASASPIAGTPAETYLREARGIVSDRPWTDDMRFLANCPRGADHAPALIALVRDARSDAPRAIHRTFLKPDGSAKDSEHGEAKMALGPTSGGVVKLTPDEDVTLGLALAEGIETALSCWALGWPTWATLSTAGLLSFPVLAGIEALTIFADHDKTEAGESAAKTCAARWREAGAETLVLRPPLADTDWNDVLRR